MVDYDEEEDEYDFDEYDFDTCEMCGSHRCYVCGEMTCFGCSCDDEKIE